MKQDFYKGRLKDKFGIEVIVPDEQAQETVHRVIYDELCQGIVLENSRQQYLQIIADLPARGAQAVSWVIPRSPCWCSKSIHP